jgi:hypothetical protein
VREDRVWSGTTRAIRAVTRHLLAGLVAVGHGAFAAPPPESDDEVPARIPGDGRGELSPAVRLSRWERRRWLDLERRLRQG